jgi:hypothetical protein
MKINTMPSQQEEKLDWKVKLKALASVNMDKEGGIYIRNISDIYEIVKDEITSLTEAHKVEMKKIKRVIRIKLEI